MIAVVVEEIRKCMSNADFSAWDLRPSWAGFAYKARLHSQGQTALPQARRK